MGCSCFALSCIRKKGCRRQIPQVFGVFACKIHNFMYNEIWCLKIQVTYEVES